MATTAPARRKSRLSFVYNKNTALLAKPAPTTEIKVGMQVDVELELEKASTERTHVGGKTIAPKEQDGVPGWDIEFQDEAGTLEVKFAPTASIREATADAAAFKTLDLTSPDSDEDFMARLATLEPKLNSFVDDGWKDLSKEYKLAESVTAIFRKSKAGELLDMKVPSMDPTKSIGTVQGPAGISAMELAQMFREPEFRIATEKNVSEAKEVKTIDPHTTVNYERHVMGWPLADRDSYTLHRFTSYGEKGATVISMDCSMGPVVTGVIRLKYVGAIRVEPEGDSQSGLFTVTLASEVAPGGRIPISLSNRISASYSQPFKNMTRVAQSELGKQLLTKIRSRATSS